MSMYSMLPKFAEELVVTCGMERIEDFKITINDAVIAEKWKDVFGSNVSVLVIDYEEGVITADGIEYDMLLTVGLKGEDNGTTHDHGQADTGSLG